MINVQQRKLTKGQCDKGHFVLHENEKYVENSL
jgi:hypothetical protein